MGDVISIAHRRFERMWSAFLSGDIEAFALIDLATRDRAFHEWLILKVQATREDIRKAQAAKATLDQDDSA